LLEKELEKEKEEKGALSLKAYGLPFGEPEGEMEKEEMEEMLETAELVA